MRVRTIVKAYFLLLLFFTSSFCMAADTEKSPPIFSPSDIIRNGEGFMNGLRKFVVEFQVGSIQTVPTSYPDGSTHQVIHLIPMAAECNGGFSVPIEPPFFKRLKEIGIEDVQTHFVGATVTLEGYVTGTALEIYGSPAVWTYHMPMNSFDAIRSVKRPQ